MRKWECSFGTLNPMKEYLKSVILRLSLGKTGLPAAICAAWFACYLFSMVFPHSEEHLLERRPVGRFQQLLRTVTTSCKRFCPQSVFHSKASSRLGPALPTYTPPSWPRRALPGTKEQPVLQLLWPISETDRQAQFGWLSFSYRRFLTGSWTMAVQAI